MTGRDVTLVLCTGDGVLLGAAAPFRVDGAWWRDVEDVVAAAEAVLGVGVRVLRVLQVPGGTDFPGGGAVAYLAEVDARPTRVDLAPWPDDPLEPHRHRMAFAEPGGHQRDLDWAVSALAVQDVTLTGRPVQVRTWNLSSIWRLPTDAGPVWLKVAPPFCGSEAAVLPLLDPDVVPTVLGAAPNRVLLADVPGQDRYDARGDELAAMARMLVGLQTTWAQRVPELERLGVLDLRPGAVLPRIHAVVERNRHELDADVQRRLDDLVDGLPARFAALQECGIPDTLVHGDFHPGNVRGVPGDHRILDWGDCGIGHPMLDLRSSLQYFTPGDRDAAIASWEREWTAAVPGCDARRAARLVRPLGPVYGALAYQRFLDNIEPTERPYHEGDPANALRTAVSTDTDTGTDTDGTA